jgi:DNA-binding NarL/FixJ family response regulator
MKCGSVILADTHAPMLDGVQSLLEEFYEVTVMVAAENSLMQAVERIQPEMAVIDVSFPMARANVLVRMREAFPAVKVIAMSMHDEPAAVERILSTGAVAVIRKQAAIKELGPAIVAVRAGRRYVSSRAQGGPHFGQKTENQAAAEQPPTS